MIKKELIIENKLGLHARPAAIFVQTANKFKSDIRVEKDGQEINGKSIMGIMMLAAGQGSTIIIKVEGEDAEEAIKKLEELILGKFGEE